MGRSGSTLFQAAGDRRAGHAAVLLLGGIWKQDEYGVLEVVVLYLLVIAAILLILMVTPNQAEYFKGLWRAQARPQPLAVVGRSVAQPGLSGDRLRASCWSTATFAWSGCRRSRGRCVDRQFVSRQFPAGHRDRRARGRVFRPGISVLLAAVRPRGLTYFALFLFLAWLVPLVAGTIMAMASTTGTVGAEQARRSA